MDTTKFQCYGLKLTADFHYPVEENPGIETGQFETPERRVTVCLLTGRFGNGKRNVFYTCGMAICNPMDDYNKETGIKTAFRDAVYNWYSRDMLAQAVTSAEEYYNELWAAFQRSRHDRPDVIEPDAIIPSILFA